MSQTLSLLLRQPQGGHPTPSAPGDGGEGGNPQAAACGALSTLKCRSVCLVLGTAGLVTLGAQRMRHPRLWHPSGRLQFLALFHPQFRSGVGGSLAQEETLTGFEFENGAQATSHL